MDNWNAWRIMPQILSIIVTATIMILIAVFYRFSLKKLKANQAPQGIALIMELFVKTIRGLVVDSLGKKWEFLTPYFVFLFMYIGIGNLLSLVGLEPPATSYTVTLAMGVVTWLGMFVIGIKVQKLGLLGHFTFKIKWLTIKTKHGNIGLVPNPLAPFEFMSKLISISVRLWGNITAGAIILSLFYVVTGNLSAHVPYIGQINFVSWLISPFLHIYFDMFAGIIQAIVFGFLTLSYWAQMAHDEEEEEIKHEQVEAPKTHSERLRTINLKK